MDITAQLHAIAHVLGDAAHKHKQQRLLHIIVAPDLRCDAAGEACVDVLLILQRLQRQLRILNMRGAELTVALQQ